MPKMNPHHLASVAGLALLLGASSALAAPEEIQVYTDDINAPGEFGLELHVNKLLSGNGRPDYPGAQAPWQVLRVTPEFSYGLTKTIELGAYFLTSVDAQGNATVDGQKLRVKYMAPMPEGSLWYWGANLEVGRVDYRLDPNPWNGELKGILGWRGPRWSWAVNASVGFKVSGPEPAPSTLQLANKLAYKVNEDYQIGLESYNDLGELGSLGRLNQQSQLLYAVVDFSLRGWEFNLGLGRGLTTVSDRWVMKAIVTVPFGK